jgi:hypothetical protein
MKIQRDRLHQYQKKIVVLTDKETDVARQMLAKGDKERALLALRRKKYQESLLSKTDAQLAQLEQLTANVEFAQIQKDVVFGLQQGTRVLTEIHGEMGGIDKVEKLMGETADAIAYQKVCRLDDFPTVRMWPLADPLRVFCTATGNQRNAQWPHHGTGRGGGRERAGGAGQGHGAQGAGDGDTGGARHGAAAVAEAARGGSGGAEAGHTCMMMLSCLLSCLSSLYVLGLERILDTTPLLRFLHIEVL